jgi:hypothetical protein
MDGQRTRANRIQEAVDDEAWQLFRKSLKGMSTEQKLEALKRYWLANALDHSRAGAKKRLGKPVNEWNDIEIRLDNYIKALCRGGQLYPGESLVSIISVGWKPRIKNH